jgi:hypothetical protein
LTPAEREEAQRIIQMQASSRPADGKIGVEGAYERASGVQVHGLPFHDSLLGQLIREEIYNDDPT